MYGFIHHNSRRYLSLVFKVARLDFLGLIPTNFEH